MQNILRLVGVWIGYALLATTALAVAGIVVIGLVANPVATTSVVLLSGLLIKMFNAPFVAHQKRWALALILVASVFGYFIPSVCAALLSVFSTYWWKAAKKINSLRKQKSSNRLDDIYEEILGEDEVIHEEIQEALDGIEFKSFEQLMAQKGLRLNLVSNLEDEYPQDSDRLVPMELDVSDEDTRDLNNHN